MCNNTISILEYIAQPFNEALPKLLPEYTNSHPISFTPGAFAEFQSASLIQIASKYDLNIMALSNNFIKSVETILSNRGEDNIFSKLWMTTPGFINVNLSDQFLTKWVNQLQINVFNIPQNQDSHVFIDFGGVNIAKKLHIGHLRSLLIGDFLQKIHRLHHVKVLSDMHLGDWGTQIGILLSEIQRRYPTLDYFTNSLSEKKNTALPLDINDLSSMYPQAVARCKEDVSALEEARMITKKVQEGQIGFYTLWQDIHIISVNYLKKLMEKLNIIYDLWKGESDVQYLIQQVVQEGLDKKVLRYDDQALIADIDSSDIPLLLVKSDGAALYSMTELATIKERVLEGATKIVYVVDKRQKLHFQQIFNCTQKLGWHVDLFHVDIGTVNDLYGKPLSTRLGGNICLDELLEQAKQFIHKQDTLSPTDIEDISLANIKFAILSYRYASDCNFDLAKFSQYNGKTGAYILYAVIRIRSILKKYSSLQNNYHNLPLQIPTNNREKALQLILCQYGSALNLAYNNYESYYLCEHAYKIATAFNKFYDTQPILLEKEEERKLAKLALCIACLQQLEQMLHLLGINIPSKM